MQFGQLAHLEAGNFEKHPSGMSTYFVKKNAI